MGCGASAGAGTKRNQLRETRAKLEEHHRQADDKEHQIQEETERLVRTVDRESQEARDALRLERELLAASNAHERELQEQRDRLAAEHATRLWRRLEQVERQAQAEEERSQFMQDGIWKGEAEGLMADELSQAEVMNADYIRCQERMAASVQEELFRTRAEVNILIQERDSEAEAASVTREALVAERRAAERQGDMLRAEVRTQVSETEALEDAHRALEDKSRSLQRELSKLTYTVGQRDHELKVKEGELQDVRHSLSTIQSEMDEVNRQLKEQCSRVQRVEGSLRVSRDLGEKVRAARAMVKESHGALAQLCGLLEQERSRREQCAQGLKQQRVRTELLLQLLHHFKSRTQDLSPQALLSGLQ